MPKYPKSDIAFNPPLVDGTPEIGRVLAEFMDKQIRLITTSAETEFGIANVPQGTVLKLLSGFVTVIDTRQPRSRSDFESLGVSSEVLAFVINKLKEARIIRDYESDTYELTHDTLAKHLASQRDDQTAAILEIVKLVKNGYETHKSDATSFLSRFGLEQLDRYEDAIQRERRLENEEWDFVYHSRKYWRRIDLKKRRQTIGLAFAAIFFAFLALVAGYNFLATKAAQAEAADNLNLAEVSSQKLANTTEALKLSRTDPTEAFGVLHQEEEQPIGLDTISKANTDSTFLQKQTLRLFRLLGYKPPEKPTESDPSYINRDLISAFSENPFYQEKLTVKADSITEMPFSKVKGLVLDNDSQYLLHYFSGSNQIYINHINDSLPYALLNKPDSLGRLLEDPITAKSLKPITTMELVAEEDLLWTGHADGSVYEWNLRNEEQKPTRKYWFEPQGEVVAITHLGDDEFYVAVDSIVYHLEVRRNRYVSTFVMGFNRNIKLMDVNPKNQNEFVIVKDRSNEILRCFNDQSILPDERRVSKAFDNIDLEAVSAISYTPDGESIIAGFEGDIIKKWKVNRPENYDAMIGHAGLITSIAFYPNNKNWDFILTGGMDKTAILWNRKGQIKKRFVGHLEPIHTVGFTESKSNQELFIYTSDESGDVRFWYNGLMASQGRSTNGPIRTMAISPKENLVAFSCIGKQEAGMYYLWYFGDKDSLVTRQQRIKPLSDRAGNIVALKFNEDGKQIVVGATNDLVTVEPVDGSAGYEDYRSTKNDQIPITDGITSLDINQEYVLIGNRKLLIDNRSYRTQNMALLRSRVKNKYVDYISLPHNLDRSAVSVVRFSSKKGYVFTGCENGMIYKWDFISKPPKVVDSLKGHSSRITAIDLTRDDGYLLSGSLDNTAIVWKYDGKTEGYVRQRFSDLSEIMSNYALHASDVTDVGFKPLSTSEEVDYFLTASTDHYVKLWHYVEKNDTITFQQEPNIISHAEAIKAAGYSYDGQLIITGGSDRIIKVWPNTSADEIISRIQTRKPW